MRSGTDLKEPSVDVTVSSPRIYPRCADSAGSVHHVVKRSGIVYLVVAALLLVLALTNRLLGTSPDSATNKEKKSPQAEAKAEESPKQRVKLPAPVGPPDARVKVRVYLTSDNTCDDTTIRAMDGLHKKFGDKIYIAYSDLLEDDVLKEAQEHKISCKTGITINGKSQFILPERGLKGTVMLDGPTGQKNYDMGDVEAIVQHILDTPELDEPDAGNVARDKDKTSTRQ